MALDLTGISNENELFSGCYLGTLLEQNYKGWVGKVVTEEGTLLPWRELQALRKSFLVVSDEGAGLAQQREWLRRALWALGFTKQLRERILQPLS